MKDLFTLAGIGLMCTAGWLVHPAWAFAVAGAACIAVGLGLAKGKDDHKRDS